MQVATKNFFFFAVNPVLYVIPCLTAIVPFPPPLYCEMFGNSYHSEGSE